MVFVRGNFALGGGSPSAYAPNADVYTYIGDYYYDLKDGGSARARRVGQGRAGAALGPVCADSCVLATSDLYGGTARATTARAVPISVPV